MKIIRYIVGALVVFLLISVAQNYFTKKKLQRERWAKEQAINNYTELLQKGRDNTKLILTLKEIRSLDLLKIDSLAYQLKIRPKTITKVIEKIITQKDTIYVPLEPMQQLDYLWEITDKNPCWLWQGEVELFPKEDSITVARTNFEYENKVTEVFWFNQKKFLFIPIGKKKYFQKSMPECGQVTTREINIIKK